MRIKISFCCCLLLLSALANAQLRLPRLISDSMVLQRDQPLVLWGWASAGESVKLHFKAKHFSDKADAAGRWRLALPATTAGGPYVMTFISARDTIRLRDIVFGDVWFCSGQSNMVHQLNIHDVTYAQDIATANYPLVRQFLVPPVAELAGPKDDLPGGRWVAAVGEAVRPFSAVAYFFARTLHERYKVPIGIINASIGGTPIEAWMSAEALQPFPKPMAAIRQHRDSAYLRRLTAPHPARDIDIQPDEGLREVQKWYAPGYQPKNWRPIHIPGYWEDQGIRNLDGVVWYRRNIVIPDSLAQKEARLWLGRIVDADEVYINGTKVGTTGYQYPQRRYVVPAGVLRPGSNLFVIRVVNHSGKGGFVPGKPYALLLGRDTIDLKGDWQYKVGQVFDLREVKTSSQTLNLQYEPAALYNGMVSPLTSFALKGYCWYQGEANTNNATDYTQLQAAMIADWRAKWKQATLPFLFVQLPGFMEQNYLPEESSWAALREAQRRTLEVPQTGMVVAIDLGEWNDIHPDNKKTVGERLALLARKLAYGENIVYTGPLYQGHQVVNNEVIIRFTQTGSGLVTCDDEAPKAFAIAGADNIFHWAIARIEGNTVILSTPRVARPVRVRYAWADNPVQPNLCNKEGLPAAPFEAGD